MIKSFLKIAFRNLSRRKGYSVLNIFGLTIGISCCLLIFTYVSYERSYDDFNTKANRIFRIQDKEYQEGNMVVPCAAAMPGVAPFMKKEFPEVEEACRLRKMEFLIGNESRNIRFSESTVYYADPSTIDILQLDLIQGNASTALDAPGKMILSEEKAKKYFGNETAIGKTLVNYSNGNPRPMQVTGVFRDYPDNSHLKLGILISYKTYSQYMGSLGKPDDQLETSFGWTDFYTYILLKKSADPKQVAAKLPAFIDRHYNSLPENKSQNDRYELTMMPLRDIHLYSNYTEEAEANSDGQSVSFLFLIAFFIIGIAWINYINLATARSLERAREVGMRKVLGAMRQGLIAQFMLESLLLNLIALIAAVLITFAFHPLFAALTGRSLPSLFSLPAYYFEIFAALFAAGTLLSGIYPALVLSRYQPVTVLKGAFKNAGGGVWLRKGLIVGQFAASVILIAGTIIVFRQLHFMRTQKLGADIDQTLVVYGVSNSLNDSSYNNIFRAFKHDLQQSKEVKSVTASSAIMGKEILWSTDWHRLNKPDLKRINLFHLSVDEDFVKSFGLKLVAGRAFSPDFASDKKAVMLNETAVRQMGYTSPQQAIGDLVSPGWNNFDSMHVVGVIADFHNESLQKAIQPLVVFLNVDNRRFYSVKISASNPSASVATVKQAWDRYFPGNPFDYFFLDEFFNRQYKENERFAGVFALFAILAIGIACFGLLGLSAYNVLQRTKEIGIRKVLGASVSSLLYGLSKDFLILVAIAILIAVPITKIVMDSWIEGFAYRIAISWWIYLIAGALAIFIALITVGYQALRAALDNPIKSLRTE